MRRHLLSCKLSCVVLLGAIWLTWKWAKGIGPFKCVHDYVGKALCVPSQETVGEVVQVEENICEIAYEAETVWWTVVVAVRSECTGLQAAHSGHLSLGKMRRTRNYPVERLGRDDVSVIVECRREGTIRDEVWEDEEVGLEDRRSR
jgi:hypothetical protein